MRVRVPILNFKVICLKKKIALVTGGFSGESVISYQSAAHIHQHLDPDLFDVYKIDIRENGWFYTSGAGVQQTVNRADFSITTESGKVSFDKALMCIHGTPGEDGKLSAYFDLIGLPYTGCDVAVSALTMNKRNTIAVVSSAGIRVAKSHLVFKDQSRDLDKIKALPFPVIVKPNDNGSSIGMTKIMDPDDHAINKALDLAFAHSHQVLIEQFIHGREFTIGVMQDATGTIITLPMTEVILKSGRELFDFEAKYNGETAEITPAEASPEMADKVAQAAKSIYRTLDCKGIVRVDFIYHASELHPYMLEVNTVPGQTKESLIPKQVAAKGWTLRDFYTELLLAK